MENISCDRGWGGEMDGARKGGKGGRREEEREERKGLEMEGE